MLPVPVRLRYLISLAAGGFQVPSSAAGFGQYSRRFMLKPPYAGSQFDS
jgi:hypothetical protein